MADVPFYPSSRYRDKNLAPEKMNPDTVTALAKAAKLALDKGILPKDVVDMMLPNLMTENRQDDYGVNRVEVKNSLLESLGINTKLAFAGSSERTPKNKTMVVPDTTRTPGNDPNSGRLISSDSLENNAKLVVAALTEKLDVAKRLTGEENPLADKVIQLWNGTGPGSENHLRKVKEADEMLKKDPGNKSLKDLWDSVLGTLPNGPIDANNIHETSAVLSTMISNYDSNK